MGYTGIYCQKQCPYPGYGDRCQQVCLCSKQRCSVFTGCQSKSNSKFSLRSTCILLFLWLKKNHRVSSSFFLQMKSNNYFAEKTSLKYLIKSVLPNVVHNDILHNIPYKEKHISNNIETPSNLNLDQIKPILEIVMALILKEKSIKHNSVNTYFLLI